MGLFAVGVSSVLHGSCAVAANLPWGSSSGHQDLL